MAADSPWPLIHAERATDTGWSTSSGPVVSGPVVSLVLAITGRPVALADRSGDGLAALGSRGQPAA